MAELRQRSSAKWRTYTADILPFTIAESDFQLDPAVAEALTAAVHRSDTGYAAHDHRYQEAFAAFAERTWEWRPDPGLMSLFPDVSVAVVEVLRTIATRPRVVTTSPVYGPFFSWIAEVGGQIVDVPCRPDDGWRLDLDGIGRAFAEGADVMLLCNPQNPTGVVHSPEELRLLVELAARYGVLLLSDEIHAPIVYAPAQFTPLLSVRGAGAVSAVVTSASKAWNLAGLKAALLITGDGARQIHSALPEDTPWRVGHFGVIAGEAAFRSDTGWLNSLIAELRDRRDLLRTLLTEELPAIQWTAPQATYTGWLDVADLGLGPHPAERFREAGNVALQPASRYRADESRFLRINFATSDVILRDGVARMRAAVDTLEHPGR